MGICQLKEIAFPRSSDMVFMRMRWTDGGILFPESQYWLKEESGLPQGCSLQLLLHLDC